MWKDGRRLGRWRILGKLLAEARTRVVLMDGGTGSTLEDRGVAVRNALWGSVALLTPRGREINDRLHADFVRAGAEILIANTHNAGLAACAAFAGPGDPGAGRRLMERVNGLAVASARRAVPPGAAVVVAAGIGSAEAPYAEASTMPPAEVAARLAPQARFLRETGVDLILFETLTTESDVEGLASLLMAEALPPVGVGLACGGDGRTLGGVTMGRAVEALLPAAPAAFFVQCTPCDSVRPALRALVAAVGGRAAVGVYANDGRRWEDQRWHGERVTPERYAALARGWLDDGARIVGGCCGTGPEHVAALRDVLR